MAVWGSLLLPCLALLLAPEPGLAGAVAEDGDWVKLPSKCEVCKYVALELKSSFEETGKTKEVIDTKYGFLDGKASKIKYTKSDIRLIEVTENICKRLLEYNLHKERSGSNRFAKGMSETFETLHNLVHKGVKVVMDIPYELWNETSAEVADLKKQCEVMVEEYEEVIEDWYRNHQEEDLSQFLCANHVLKGKDTSCDATVKLLQYVGMASNLDGSKRGLVKPMQEKGASCLAEKWTGKKGDPASSGQKKTKKKEGKGNKSSKSKKGRKDEAKQEKDNVKLSAEEAPSQAMEAEEEEDNVQKVAPLLHSADEL
ncbi:hypothetical protein EYD10_02289 [Varanus komodoensis]|nr:hypothetical protein EYD10_02289 [Varanus komodoensis]